MLGVVFVILILLPWAIIRSIEIGPIFIAIGMATLVIGGFFRFPIGSPKKWKPLLKVLLISVIFLILGACFSEVYIRDIF